MNKFLDALSQRVGDWMLTITVASLIGSAVAGWFAFWAWLIVPIAVHWMDARRVISEMRSERTRFFRHSAESVEEISRSAWRFAIIRLVAIPALSNVAIFCVAFAAYALFR